MSTDLTAAEAARELGITKSLVCRYCRQGRIAHRRVAGDELGAAGPYRIPVTAVREFVRRPVGRPPQLCKQ